MSFIVGFSHTQKHRKLTFMRLDVKCAVHADDSFAFHSFPVLNLSLFLLLIFRSFTETMEAMVRKI